MERLISARRSRAVFTAISPRLFMLICTATLPLVALLVMAGLHTRTDTMALAARQAVMTARLASERQDDVIQEARHLLTVLARVPDVRSFAPSCHALLRQIVTDHSRIPSLAAVHPDGTVGCHSMTPDVVLNLDDRSYIREALDGQGKLVVSAVLLGRITQRPTVVLALPMLGTPPASAAAGVVIASIDLGSFLGTPDERPADVQAHIIDIRDGTVLATDPSGRQSGFRTLTNKTVAAIRATPGGGTFAGPDMGGEEMLYGFAPLASTHESLFVVMDRPLSTIVAEVHQRLRRDLALGLAAVFAALLAAWLLGNRSIAVPVQRLAAFAGQIGAGRLDTPAPALPGAVAELQSLRGAITDMADRLRKREAQVADMQKAVALSAKQHRLLAENGTDMITLLSPALIRMYVSPASLDLLGRVPEELLGQHASSMVHPADLPAISALLHSYSTGTQETERTQYRALHKNGRVLWLESCARRLSDNEGYVVTTRDVTERRTMEEQLEAANRHLRIQALQDPLTGIANRRRFDEMLGVEFRRAHRLAEPLSILMIDIDHFKAFNDTYGHPAGDACLRTVAARIDQQLRRPGDMLGRYGGEEFACILPGAEAVGALQLAESIRHAVVQLGITHAASPTGVLTVSIGLVTLDPPGGSDGPAMYMEAADGALYQAKHNGRNMVCVAQTQRA